MHMNLRICGAAIMVVISLGLPSWGQASTAREQSVFDAETLAVDHPVAIPSDVLNLISEDKDVKQVMESQNLPHGKAPREWFSASCISRANPDKELYLIIANGPLIGAHVTTFWLVSNGSGENSPTVLFRTTADQLKIGGTDASGYPRITAVRLTAAKVTESIYHLVDGRYVPLRSVK